MTNDQTILNVELGDRSYPIYIGCDLLSQKSFFEDHISGQQVMVVSNTTVAPLYLDRVTKSLDNFTVKVVILPCLLYTSPSPRDGLLSRMPSSA